MSKNDVKELFYDFTEENMLPIVKGMIKITNNITTHRNTPKNIDSNSSQLVKPVPNWEWVKKNQYYLVSNITHYFLINKFESETMFWYYQLASYDAISPWSFMGDALDITEIKKVINKHINMANTFGIWELARSDYPSDRWVKGLIIPINNKQSNFINWTTNPLED